MDTLEQIINRCESTGAWYGEKITDVNQKNFMGDSVLHTVSSWGDVNAVKILIRAGADVNAIGDQGATPLFNAVIGKSLDVISHLLISGADPQRKNAYGRSVIDYAKNVSAPAEIIKKLSQTRNSD
jgi:uncharacterized protein